MEYIWKYVQILKKGVCYTSSQFGGSGERGMMNKNACDEKCCLNKLSFTQDEVKATPLCVASQNGHLHIASLLIKKKADVEYVTEVCLLHRVLKKVIHRTVRLLFISAYH